jgi:hypothetical protein
MNVPTVNDPARQSSRDKPDCPLTRAGNRKSPGCRKLIFKDRFARSVKWRPRSRDPTMTARPDDLKAKAEEYGRLADAAADPNAKKKFQDLAREGNLAKTAR